MSSWKIAGWGLLGIVVLLALGWGFGWFGVFYTGTVGKAQKDVERQVFENTQSYVEGKRQEATKLYKEWLQAETEEERKAIESIVALNFANFDETKLPNKLQVFVYNCKYNP